MTESFKLPLLQQHEEALEKCVYCPKLCRASCAVSVVSGSESLTPWGKMSLAYFQARGDVELSEDIAASAWACSSCLACKERCEHDHSVAEVLGDVRTELRSRGASPPQIQRVVDEAKHRSLEMRRAAEAIMTNGQNSRSEGVPLLVGCSYMRHAPAEAEDICQVAERLIGPIQLQSSCCGLPLLDAGEPELFVDHLKKLSASMAGKDRVVVADPGCARALLDLGPRLEPDLEIPEVILLVDAVYANLDRIPAAVFKGRAVGYQDPCQLGRGLGRYEEPRAILARICGQPPKEMVRNRQHAECSGGGGLLPLTYPDISSKMAAEQIAEQEQHGGELVTACASSLRRYRRSGAGAVELMSLVAEAMRRTDEG